MFDVQPSFPTREKGLEVRIHFTNMMKRSNVLYSGEDVNT